MNTLSAATRTSRWVTAVLVIFTLFGFGFGNWLSRIPATRDHLGASTLEMSVIGLILASGSIVGLVFAGRTVSWLGPRRAIVYGAVGQSVFMPLGAVLLWWGLPVPGVIALALFGVCFSTGDVAMNVSGANAERALGKARMPLLHAGYSFGGVSAMGVGALAELAHIPVPIHLAIVFALITLGCLLAVRHVPRNEFALSQPTSATESHAGVEVAAPGYNPWRDPRIIVIGLIVMSVSLAEGTATDWLPLALADNRGFTNSNAALTLGVFFVSMMLTRVAGAALLGRFGRVAVLRSSALFIVAAIVLINLVPLGWVSVVAAAFWGVGCAFGFPLGVSAAADDPKTAVRGVATVSAIAYAAFLIGPMLVGFLGEHFGLLPAFWPLLVFAIFVVLAAGVVREPEASKNP